MKTAVVHDWLNGMRGGEKVLEAMLPLLPDPTVFTLFHVPGSVSAGIERYPIVASCLNRLPFARTAYRNYMPLFPRAVESFDLSGFDLVVSSSHCVAKGAIAPAGRAAPLLLPHARALGVRPVRPLLPARDDAAVRRQARRRGAAARVGPRDGRTADELSRQLDGGRRPDPPYVPEARGRLPSAGRRRLLSARTALAARRLPPGGRRPRSVQAVRGGDRGGADV